MVAHEDVYNGIAMKRLKTREELSKALATMLPYDLTNDDVVFLCVGTDRSTGDAVGPMIGTYLTEFGYTNVVGTLENPCHAVNLADRAMEEVPEGKTVIAIDAALGKYESVGTFSVEKGSMSPGAGLGKKLGEYGDYSVTAVVNVAGFMEYFVLQNTRLRLSMHMAKDITSALMEVLPLNHAKPIVEDTYVPAVEQIASTL